MKSSSQNLTKTNLDSLFREQTKIKSTTKKENHLLQNSWEKGNTVKINAKKVNTAPHILSQIAFLEKYFIKVDTTFKVVVES